MERAQVPAPKLPLYGNSHCCSASRERAARKALACKVPDPANLTDIWQCLKLHSQGITSSPSPGVLLLKCSVALVPRVEKRYKSPSARAIKRAIICGNTRQAPQPAGCCLTICSLLLRTVGEKEPVQQEN